MLWQLGGWWRWPLVSSDGVATSRIVGVSAYVNLPLHHKVRSSLLAPAHPGGPEKRAVKTVVCVCVCGYCVQAVVSIAVATESAVCWPWYLLLLILSLLGPYA